MNEPIYDDYMSLNILEISFKEFRIYLEAWEWYLFMETVDALL
jgi:hypothetical protein